MSRSQISNVAAFAFALPLATLLITSCTYGPPTLHPPDIDPSSAGELAMEQYDTNGDGQVAGDELAKAPSLKSALPRLDSNGDKAVTADEIAARVKVWQGTKLGLMSFTCRVTLNGRPLEGATVTFEPEAFLGDEIKQAVCTTDEFGMGAPSVPKELRPDPARTPPGVHLGLYQVKISKIVGGKESIPARYNGPTTLGQEVSPDVPEISTLRITYALSTR